MIIEYDNIDHNYSYGLEVNEVILYSMAFNYDPI